MKTLAIASDTAGLALLVVLVLGMAVTVLHWGEPMPAETYGGWTLVLLAALLPVDIIVRLITHIVDRSQP